MKNFLSLILLLLAFIVFSAGPVQAQWTNGQNALMVIGQPNFTSGGAGVTATTLNAPKDVAIDITHGKMYIADAGNNRVLRYAYPITSTQPAAEMVFGQPNFTSNNFPALPSQNTFLAPWGIAVDPTGRLWVSDLGNNRVVWFDQAYAIGTNQPNASGVLGQLDFVTRGCVTAQNTVCAPYGLAISANFTLFVADASSNRVLRFDNAPGKANGANADGVLGQPNFTSNGNAVTQSGMNTPRGATLQGTTLYIADNNNARVLRFDNAPGKVNGANADGVLGQPDFISNDPALSQNGMVLPGRVAVDPGGRLYVSEGLGANRVLIFTDAAIKANGGAADFVIGQPDFTTGSAATTQSKMNLDSNGGGLAIDYGNNLLMISDDNNNRIMVFQAQFPRIVLDPVSLSFTTTQGINPADKTLTLSNGGEGALPWTVTVQAGAPEWLLVNPMGGTGNHTLTVSVNVTGLAPGLYTKTIEVSAPGAINTPQTVTVTLTVDQNKIYLPFLHKSP